MEGPPWAEQAWHSLGVAEVEALLRTSPAGLSSAEVEVRLQAYGPNRLQEDPPPSAIIQLLRQFASPLILILVVAACITWAMGELLDTSLIVVALALNAAIGFVQERKAASAVHALMHLVVPHSRVVRDGREQQVDSPALVPGDLVVLEPGARVPADLRLVAVNELMVDESLLTGESLAVTKQTGVVDRAAVVADRSDMVYTGSIVASGRARGYVVATAERTELGSIAGLIRREEAAEAPLHARMHRFAQLIAIGVLVAAAIAFVSGVAVGESASQMFHTAVAIAVSAVPEGLPVAVTITLAIGVSRMARRHAVVRRLAAVETLGSTTVIGSDKTGTLTENRMTVRALWVDGRTLAVPEDLQTGWSEAVRLTLLTGALTNEGELAPEDGEPSTGDPTEVALLRAADDAGIDPRAARASHPVLADIPFEPEHRYSATFREDHHGRRLVFVKGAPERVLGMCASMLGADGPVPLDAPAAAAGAHALAADGLRVLAMAYRAIPAGCEIDPHDDPHDLVLVGLQGMMDPPRTGVRGAIDACHRAGVRVVMITGDHADTAHSIGARLGIARADEPVTTGADLVDLPKDSLRRLVSETSVFARVSPSDKLRIVRALQDDGNVVAVTGDGVNDAPALRAGAIGVSMGLGGTDVAREASDMVLSDDNFVSIVSAIEEGRIAFSNIRKVSFFLISTALAETIAILVSVWLGWPLLLVPTQILWLNLVTNGVQDLALAFEPGSPDVLRRPPRPRREGIISPMMWERTAVTAAVMATGALVMFRWQLDQGGSLIEAQTVALTTLVVFNVFQAGNSRAENRSLFRMNPLGNPFLFWASITAITLHVSALYFPPTQYVLRVEPISLGAWVRAILVATSIVAAMELHKAVRRRWPLQVRDYAARSRTA